MSPAKHGRRMGIATPAASSLVSASASTASPGRHVFGF